MDLQDYYVLQNYGISTVRCSLKVFYFAVNKLITKILVS